MPTFEIGLVGAGAISAGAYTAGVIDFMVQALDSWYAAKDDEQALPLPQKKVPPHDVTLSVLSGASAGGMTAAVAVAYLGSDQPSITTEEDARTHQGKNKLFDSWVEQIDIGSLLEGRDFADAQSPVVSLLDSSVLAAIADSGLAVTPRGTRRRYVAENLELLLTVTNLRGVPYAIQVTGDQPTTYDMSLHADYVHFRISDSGSALPDRYVMRWEDFGASGPNPLLRKLKLAALATGAFPAGLAPRTLSHILPGNGRPDCYSSRMWPIPYPDNDSHIHVQLEPIPVGWPQSLPPDYLYNYQCVDGGVMNNEPFELAHRILAGPGGRNHRLGQLADRAILLIDPFPSESMFAQDYTSAPDLLRTVLCLFDALKNQACFKADELVLAAREDVFSRFMIAPSRGGAAYPIACGALGGFGGFLKRDFRAHDYFLGRRNAQKFLRDHFVLPETNGLFCEWAENEEMKKAYGVWDSDSRSRFLPIIPLVGPARMECYVPKWPTYTTDDLNILMERIGGRVDLVLDHLVKQYFKTNCFIVRFLVKKFLGSKKKDVVEFVNRKVTSDLQTMGLLV